MKVLKGIYSGCKRPNVKCFRRSRVRPRGVNLAYFCEQSSFCVCAREQTEKTDRTQSSAKQNFILMCMPTVSHGIGKWRLLSILLLWETEKVFGQGIQPLKTYISEPNGNEKAMPCRCTHFLSQMTAGS